MVDELPPAFASIDDPNLDWEKAMRTSIFLGGALQKDVTAYNCEEGWLTRHVRTPDGKPQIDHLNHRVMSERVTGVVTVAFKEAING